MDIVLQSTWLLFRQIQSTAYIVIEWFMSPIDSSLAELLDIAVDTTYIELSVGALVPAMLFLVVFAFVKNALSWF